MHPLARHFQNGPFICIPIDLQEMRRAAGPKDGFIKDFRCTEKSY